MTILDLRNRTGLSQNKFATKFHISVRTLQRWEQGNTDTPEHILYMIEHILNLEDMLNRLKNN